MLLLATLLAACGRFQGEVLIYTTTPADQAEATSAPSATHFVEEASTKTSTPTAKSNPLPTPIPLKLTEIPAVPLDQISQESLFAYLEDLTAIQPYSGWRNSATEGEAEALDYVTDVLGEFPYLQELGLELERQSFRVYNSTELWETRLFLNIDGQEIEIPADGLRGHRHDDYLALRFDSDGKINDDERNPVIVEQGVVFIDTFQTAMALEASDLSGKIAIVNFAAVDRTIILSFQDVQAVCEHLLSLHPAGILLVTQFSNVPGESHGAFVGDSTPFKYIEINQETPSVPILYARLEDMTPAGISGWDDFSRIAKARLVWDADVFSPGTSGNLVARIPGTDPGRAVILGAHIDSPNCPGAMDDGSGSVVLLEIARILEAEAMQPPTDLYLVWFGSEEIALDGSSYFVATHQELLDRTVAMLSVDDLTRPLDGIEADVHLATWSYLRHGDGRLLWTDYLVGFAGAYGLEVASEDRFQLQSDNGVFIGFDVPNANLAYESPEMQSYGSFHYAAHIHDPYDTVALAREEGEALVEMTEVALLAALGLHDESLSFRVSPPPDKRALIISSHTEMHNFVFSGLIDFMQTLAMGGFDVDLLPYDQPVNKADLEGTDLVIILPVVDYPGQAGNNSLYDAGWDEEEINQIERYVSSGGFVLITNSAYRLDSFNRTWEVNEDWRDLNLLSERFGITYRYGSVPDIWPVKADHPLMKRVILLDRIPQNDVPFTISPIYDDSEIQALVTAGSKIIAGLVTFGSHGGQVLALTDVGLLSSRGGSPKNLQFWRNLVDYIETD